MTLDEVSIGQAYVVTGFGEQASAFQVRLMAQGLIPASPITVLRKAPFGDPLQVKVGSTLLSVRKQEARQIIVGEMNE
jgi:ferrous iron transport protein A